MTFYRLFPGCRGVLAVFLALWILWPANVVAAAPTPPSALTDPDALGGLVQINPADLPLESPDRALAAYRNGQFQPFDHMVRQGFQPGSAWLAFDLAAVPPDDHELLMLQIGPGQLDRVTVYLALPDGSLRLLGEAGDQVPREAIALPYLKPTFSLRAPTTEGHTVLVRIDNHSSHAAYARLFKASQFPDVATRHGLLLGILLTIGALILGAALWLYSLLRQPLYLIWFSYAGLMWSLLLLNNGIVYHYVPWLPQAWINPLTDTLSLLVPAAGGWFLVELFGLRQRHAVLMRLASGWAALLVGLALVIPWWPDARPLQVGLILLLPALLAASAGILLLMLRRDTLALGIGPPLLLYLLTTLFYVLSLLGYGVYSVSFHWFWNTLGFLLLLVLQGALFLQALATQRSSQAERTQLVRSLSDKNQALEDEVRARTRELEHALRDVQQAEAEQRQLLTMASHEFRTPAAMIKMSLDSLRFLSHSIPPEVSSRLDNIRLASQRLTLLTNSLIVDNRLREPRLQTHPAPLALDQVIRDVVAGYPASTPITLDLPTTPVWLQADATLLSIALHNLIDNALNHGTSARPQVAILLEAQPRQVVVTVADNGPGIPDAEKEKVFERFRRRTTSRGSGLGLSIVRAIVRAHNGGIAVHDNLPHGARLVMSLPRDT